MDKKSTNFCKKCGLVCEPKIEKVPLPSGGFHQKAVCSGCKKFIKFLAHGNSIPTLYFGKHKGSTVSEVAKTDPNYLRWLDGMGIGSARLQGAVKEALSCRK